MLTYVKLVISQEWLVYINNAESITNTLSWTSELIEHHRQMDNDWRLNGGYGEDGAADIRRHIKEHMADIVKGGHILVIGSQSPWIEAILLNLGASNITTLEHNPIISTHPQIRAINPQVMKEMVTSYILIKNKV